MEIGLIGSGALGTFLLETLNKEKRFAEMRVSAVFDEREKSRGKLATLAETYHVTPFHTLDDFLHSNIDVVVECANVEAVQQYALEVIQRKDLLVISVGALVDGTFYATLQEKAKQSKRKLMLPSGAIGGLDLVKAATLSGGLEEVSITTRKPAASLQASTERGEETVLFSGFAREAIQRFPKNINVAIILSLAGLGPDETKVEIIADPHIDKNEHTLFARGDFGTCTIVIENFPMPTNPKTSYLTALSILSALKSLSDPVVIT